MLLEAAIVIGAAVILQKKGVPVKDSLATAGRITKHVVNNAKREHADDRDQAIADFRKKYGYAPELGD